MLAYTYKAQGRFALENKPKPTLQDERDAIVKVTLASICSSDIHIKHGAVPRAVEGITVGHEMVGIVEEIGSKVRSVKPAWKLARPNAIVTVVALYEEDQVLPLPKMYGKNLTFKTGGVDGCDCDEILRLIAAEKIDTTQMIVDALAVLFVDKIGYRTAAVIAHIFAAAV